MTNSRIWYFWHGEIGHKQADYKKASKRALFGEAKAMSVIMWQRKNYSRETLSHCLRWGVIVYTIGGGGKLAM